MSAQQEKPWLTAEQVYQLNEKHGWFQYGDAQSDVSQAFAQDAIEMHERMRAAAPEMLAALIWALEVIQEEVADGSHIPVAQAVAAAIAKAAGSAA